MCLSPSLSKFLFLPALPRFKATLGIGLPSLFVLTAQSAPSAPQADLCYLVGIWKVASTPFPSSFELTVIPRLVGISRGSILEAMKVLPWPLEAGRVTYTQP